MQLLLPDQSCQKSVTIRGDRALSNQYIIYMTKYNIKAKHTGEISILQSLQGKKHQRRLNNRWRFAVGIVVRVTDGQRLQ